MVDSQVQANLNARNIISNSLKQLLTNQKAGLFLHLVNRWFSYVINAEQLKRSRIRIQDGGALESASWRHGLGHFEQQ